MFKFVILVTLCGIMFTESKPSEKIYTELTDNNHRVARSTELIQNAMNLAGQVANEGLQAATTGMNILATAAQQGWNTGTSIAAQAAKSAISMV